jgi:hypothetical protein
MLRITLEYLPDREPKYRHKTPGKVIRVIYVKNQLTGSWSHGDYKCLYDASPNVRSDTWMFNQVENVPYKGFRWERLASFALNKLVDNIENRSIVASTLKGEITKENPDEEELDASTD